MPEKNLCYIECSFLCMGRNHIYLTHQIETALVSVWQSASLDSYGVSLIKSSLNSHFKSQTAFNYHRKGKYSSLLF